MGTTGTDAYQSTAAAWDAGMWGEDKLNSSAKLGGLKRQCHEIFDLYFFS